MKAISKKIPVALFNHHPECSIDCCNGMVEALSPYYKIDLFTKDQFNKVILKEYTAVMFPGGIGDSHSHYNFFSRRQGNLLAEYIESGGKYLGICMGAYWAGPWYFDLLDNVDVVQYIRRPNADVRRSFATTVNIDWVGQNHDMFFYDGCTYLGDKNTFQTISTYANGDPMAIIQGNVGLIGCHLESEHHWYNKKFLTAKWHNRLHHRLLLDFLDRLITQ